MAWEGLLNVGEYMVTICFVVGSATLNIYVIVVSALCYVDFFFSRHIIVSVIVRH